MKAKAAFGTQGGGIAIPITDRSRRAQLTRHPNGGSGVRAHASQGEAMTDLANLTEDEQRIVTAAAAILAEHTDPRSPAEIRAEAERLEYEQRIAESAARAARDPNAQALAAE